MKALAQVMFAVAVIGGWLMALLWMAFSVSQIAVERSVTVPPCAVSVESGGTACAPVP